MGDRCGVQTDEDSEASLKDINLRLSCSLRLGGLIACIHYCGSGLPSEQLITNPITCRLHIPPTEGNYSQQKALELMIARELRWNSGLA